MFIVWLLVELMEIMGNKWKNTILGEFCQILEFILFLIGGWLHLHIQLLNIMPFLKFNNIAHSC
jgi:hypothetical protein